RYAVAASATARASSHRPCTTMRSRPGSPWAGSSKTKSRFGGAAADAVSAPDPASVSPPAAEAATTGCDDVVSKLIARLTHLLSRTFGTSATNRFGFEPYRPLGRRESPRTPGRVFADLPRLVRFVRVVRLVGH